MPRARNRALQLAMTCVASEGSNEPAAMGISRQNDLDLHGGYCLFGLLVKRFGITEEPGPRWCEDA